MILAAAAWSLYERVSLYFSEDTISVSPKPVPLPKFEEEEEGEKAPAEKPAARAPEQKTAPASDKPAAAEAPARTKAVKTSFEYKGPGKSVTLAGSFSVWRELKMTRKNGSWLAEVYILPGTYTYHFTVDGKKAADPGKPKAPTGDSIVTVE
ncbi:MAG: hypothetical protein FD189_1208 [Elusimicrobia bacterium]|nr:MAG: hypothetical protein FD154_1662 [Elusimicrobiota bacterium]KAF0155960.1 MAG: hypothetical protein FD189_1208 [Elusimicrobiota bacterium]